MLESVAETTLYERRKEVIDWIMSHSTKHEKYTEKISEYHKLNRAIAERISSKTVFSYKPSEVPKKDALIEFV